MAGFKTGKDIVLPQPIGVAVSVLGQNYNQLLGVIRNARIDSYSDLSYLFNVTEKTANKGVANGYPGLNANTLVGGSNLGSGTPANGDVLTYNATGQAGIWTSPSGLGMVGNADAVDGYHAADIIALIPGPATTVTNETTYGISPAVGASPLYARGDHTHGTPAAQQWGD
ncbi:MAG: hypothetical protein QME51_01765, partial [Planctomycetota bacterium]|nr:hypothetical protein [Planctomycetota bacterium]